MSVHGDHGPGGEKTLSGILHRHHHHPTMAVVVVVVIVRANNFLLISRPRVCNLQEIETPLPATRMQPVKVVQGSRTVAGCGNPASCRQTSRSPNPTKGKM